MPEKDQTIAANFNTEILKTVNSPATHVELFFKGREMAFSKEDLPVMFGRDEAQCQIVVKNDVASRIHCTLEVRDNQIGISDTSTNGTFIRIGRNESFVIRRSFYPLIGQGNIRLGEQFNDDDSDTVYFRMVTKGEAPPVK